MANSKISALTSATTPLAGTEVLPIVQSGATVKVANNDLRPKQIQSNATSGVLQIAGPAAATTRVMTTPDANFTAARTDAAQTFTGVQTLGTAVGTPTANGNAMIVNATSTAPSASTGNIQIITTNSSAVDLGGSLVLGGQYNGTSNSRSFAMIAGRKANSTAGNFEGYCQISVQPDAASMAEVARWTAAGNLVPKNANTGINFTANTGTAGMTSQLLNWYEEGTWTPNQGAGLTLVGAFSSAGTYTRVGRQVFVQGSVSGATSVAVASAGAITSNLPFSAAVNATGAAINAANNTSSVLRVSSATLTAATAIAATATITFSATYSV
jgi:hypothetical protein